METIDITPSPLEAARTIAYILRGAYGLGTLVDKATDYQLLLGWKQYENVTEALDINPNEGTKSLHKEILRLKLQEAIELGKDVPIDAETTYADIARY